MSGNRRKCEICGLQETRRGGFFANFPIDEDRCKIWIKLVGTDDLVHLPIEKLHSNRHICEDHFERKYFNKKGNRLKKKAIPSLNLSAPPLSDEQMKDFPLHVASKTVEKPSTIGQIPAIPSTSSKNYKKSVPCQATCKPDVKSVDSFAQEVQIPPDTVVRSENETTPKKLKTDRNSDSMLTKGIKRKLEDSTDITPRKKKLMNQLKKTKCTLVSLKKSSKLIENVESSVLKNLVLDALKNQKRRPKGQRWSTKNKISALAIFKRSAKTYRYLSNIIPLPSEKKVAKCFKKNPSKYEGRLESYLPNIERKDIGI